jgi:hypothetical protein
MTKVKIRLIDRVYFRAKDILGLLEPFNLWTEDESLVSKYYCSGVNDLPMLEPKDNHPDLVFCHLSDLICNDLSTESTYIEDCIDKQIPIILFSGGGIEVSENNNGNLHLKTDDGMWQVRRSEHICVVDANVNIGSDLNLEKAMPLFHTFRSRFMRQIRIKNLLSEDLGTLFSILMNQESWNDATKKERIWELCQEICHETKHERPELFMGKFEALRNTTNYQAEIRRLNIKLYETFSHFF